MDGTSTILEFWLLLFLFKTFGLVGVWVASRFARCLSRCRYPDERCCTVFGLYSSTATAVKHAVSTRYTSSWYSWCFHSCMSIPAVMSPMPTPQPQRALRVCSSRGNYMAIHPPCGNTKQRAGAMLGENRRGCLHSLFWAAAAICPLPRRFVWHMHVSPRGTRLRPRHCSRGVPRAPRPENIYSWWVRLLRQDRERRYELDYSRQVPGLQRPAR